MPIHMVWDDEAHTILHHIYDGEWTPDELHRAVDLNYELQATVAHPVDVISDFTNNKTYHVPLTISRHMEQRVPPNQRLIVIVAVQRGLQMSTEAVRKLAPKTTANFRTADTLDEARVIIQDFRDQHADESKLPNR